MMMMMKAMPARMRLFLSQQQRRQYQSVCASSSSSFLSSSSLQPKAPRAAAASLFSSLSSTSSSLLLSLTSLRPPQQQTQQQRRELHLSPREEEQLQVHAAGRLAQYRLARGLRLNLPESIALIVMQLNERIRNGDTDVATLMQEGQTLLGHYQVMPGVAHMIPQVQLEAIFRDGTKLLTIHHPIQAEHGNLQAALEGSFLPVPDRSVFEKKQPQDRDTEDLMSYVPGQVTVANGGNNKEIELNPGRPRRALTITNRGDRPIQVGSHYPLAEANAALEMDRLAALGMRLDIAAGTSIRFEAGESKRIQCVSIAGNQIVLMGNSLTQGKVSDVNPEEFMQRIEKGGFRHKPEEPDSSSSPPRPATMDRNTYADMFGPTVGDMVTLGDTALRIRVERDYTTYGDECKFGGGKTIREGMGQCTSVLPKDALDVVITNALIVDAVQGIIKADVGIKGMNIVGIGKAGNPDVMDNVHPNLIVGNATDVIAGEKLILTAGGIDTHIHWICPQQIQEAAASGITTMFGGGTGPSAGTCATTCTPSPSQVQMMLAATDAYPLNFGFSGKGNTSDASVLYDVLAAGAAGFKLHEDWGTTPSSIRTALDFAEQHDVAITIHTDTLNESGYVDDSIAAMEGRTIHTYHTEGAGGGHAPDIIKVVQESYVLPSSTNPTRPFTVNTVDEHLDMLMVCHHLNPSIQEDVAFASSRIRNETIAAEDILHDIGAISMISSDSQAMGRVGEVICRTWQTADKMKQQRGRLPEEDSEFGDDNFRVKRYIAKYTMNPAITHGMSKSIGSVEVGKMADLVLWKPSMFGAKPEMIIKGGAIAYSQMGAPGASIPTPQPQKMRGMFGATSAHLNSVAFVSQAAVDAGIQEKYGLSKTCLPVHNCRNLTKADMIHNDATPSMSVDPETFAVIADGELLTCEPIDQIPLAQRFFLF